jgi:hypothetical protein
MPVAAEAECMQGLINWRPILSGLRSTLLNVEMAGSQEDAYVRVISGGHGVGAASRRG